MTCTRTPPALASHRHKYGALPESYDVAARAPLHHSKDAPLRPELLESVTLLYGATRDPALLLAGGAMLDALNAQSRVRCGFAAVADVGSGRLDNRMDSYVLAETLKYAFLLFDGGERERGGRGVGGSSGCVGRGVGRGRDAPGAPTPRRHPSP